MMSKWEDQEYKKKMSKVMSKNMTKNWQDDEFRHKMEQANEERWNDPEYRNKMEQAMKSLWENEDYRNMMSSSSSQRMIDNWNDPEYREKTLNALISGIGERNVKRWQEDENYRNMMVQATHERWQNGVYGTLPYDNLNKINSRHEEFCNKCGKVTFHNGFNTCVVCFPNGTPKSFIEKEHNCPVHNDEALQYYDKSLGNYVCWSCYKEKFSSIEYTNDFIDEIKKDYVEAEVISTFRRHDSESWAGARAAFEQSLIDGNIGWFAYVKFYIDKTKGEMKPLVVGKTGSALKNITGTDVSFSENSDDGPARKYLSETNQQWNKEIILVIPCELEDEALSIERIIQEKYQLFYS